MQKDPSIYQSDLAEERHEASFHSGGVFFAKEKRGCATISELRILNEEGAQAIGRSVGRYVTVSYPDPHLLLNAERFSVIEALKSSFRLLLTQNTKRILVIGLGNRHFTADSIGVRIAEGVNATVYGTEEETKLPHIAVLIPGTFAQSGIQTVELVKAAVGVFHPDTVVAIDALAARDKMRLLRAVELCDTGIAPGSGVRAAKTALSEQTLGVRTIGIGIPTVMRSSAFLHAALNGIEDTRDRAAQIVQSEGGFFVVPPALDSGVRQSADLVRYALNRAFGTEE